MSNRIRVAALASMVALGIVLAAPAFAQDDLNAHRHIRASDQERSFTTPPSATDIYYEQPQFFRQCSDSPARC
jgi:hypothetical protein